MIGHRVALRPPCSVLGPPVLADRHRGVWRPRVGRTGPLTYMLDRSSVNLDIVDVMPFIRSKRWHTR